MKVTYLHQYFSTPNSNGGIRSYEMAKRLVARGDRVDMVTSSAFIEGQFELKPGWNKFFFDGINLHILKLAYSNEMGFLRRVYVFFEFAIKSFFYCRKIDSDLVFATSTPLTIGLPGVLVSRKKKIPLVFEVRDLWPDVPIALGVIRNPVAKFVVRWLERWIYNNSKGVIALSPGMADGVKAVSNVSVAVVPNAADIDFFQNFDCQVSPDILNLLSGGKVAVYTGTIGKVNNVSYLVELASVVYKIDPMVKIAVFGVGAERALVENKARDLGVWNVNFFIFDPIPKKQLPFLLRFAQMSISTVLPVQALWINSANKYFDALAAAKPIVINHGGWQADLIAQFGIGIVLNEVPGESDAKRFVKAIGDSVWLEEAGSRALKLARDRYSRDVLFNVFSDVLDYSVDKK